MRVIVLGGGVIGTTAAFELQDDGHEVTLVERNSGVGQFTSFANAGLVAPGHAFAWASPKAPKILLKSLWRNDQAFRFRPSLSPALWGWTMKFLRECTAERARINTQHKHRLCTYSRAVMHDITASGKIAYDGSDNGLLFFHRTQQTLDRGIAHMQILRDLGQEMDILDRDQVAALDPALAPAKEKIAGGIYAKTDGMGDAHKFTREMAHLFAERGGTLKTGVTVEGFDYEGDRITGVLTSSGRMEADAYVLAMGIYSPHVAKAVGVNLPIYPVKGYSITFDIAGSNLAPSVGAVDEDNLIAYSRLGDRLRVTATAEFSGYDDSHKPSDFAVMTRKIRELLPTGADYSRPDYWAGLRPMTPHGAPYLGKAGYSNLYLNTGHGHIGWTMACGSARITRDLVAGRKPEIDMTGLTLQ